MSYDILTFMGEEPKAKSLAVEKYLEKNCDSKLWKHCHTKCRKSCCKSATTGIVIKKILKEKEMFDIKSIFWGRALGIRERERERERETKSCPLLSCCSPPQEERKGVAGNSIISRRSVKVFVCLLRHRFLYLWNMRIEDFEAAAKQISGKMSHLKLWQNPAKEVCECKSYE